MRDLEAQLLPRRLVRVLALILLILYAKLPVDFSTKLDHATCSDSYSYTVTARTICLLTLRRVIEMVRARAQLRFRFSQTHANKERRP